MRFAEPFSSLNYGKVKMLVLVLGVKSQVREVEAK